MEYNQDINAGVCTFYLSGKFTFTDNQQFRDILRVFNNKEVKKVVFDFSNIDFLDSSALGMLLLAKEKSEEFDRTIILKNPIGKIRKIFEVSKFDSLFEII